MSCASALLNSEGGFRCSVSGNGCVFIAPDSKLCAAIYQEGPDAKRDKCEDCADFYVESGRRCCKQEPLALINGKIQKSKFIEADVVCCGGFTSKIAKGSKNVKKLRRTFASQKA